MLHFFGELALEFFGIETFQPKVGDADLTELDVGYGFEDDAGRGCHRADLRRHRRRAWRGRCCGTRTFGEPADVGQAAFGAEILSRTNG